MNRVEQILASIGASRVTGADPARFVRDLSDALAESLRAWDIEGRNVVSSLLGREVVYPSADYTYKAFSLAKAADAEIVRQVQKTLASGLVADPTDAIAAIGNFTRAYADVVVRTNLASAYSDGLKAAVAEAPDLIPAFRFDAVMDADTRENHAAAHGLIAPVGDPVWERFTPPLGHNCRCALVPLTAETYAAYGGRTLYPPNFDAAGPDPGFIPG